jgi:hypothetical protein
LSICKTVKKLSNLSYRLDEDKNGPTSWFCKCVSSSGPLFSRRGNKSCTTSEFFEPSYTGVFLLAARFFAVRRFCSDSVSSHWGHGDSAKVWQPLTFGLWHAKDLSVLVQGSVLVGVSLLWVEHELVEHGQSQPSIWVHRFFASPSLWSSHAFEQSGSQDSPKSSGTDLLPHD